MSIYGEYLSKCTHPGCLGQLLVEQAISAGLSIGAPVPPSPFDEKFGRCPLCRRYTMVVTEAPVQRIIPRETGFTKIPTE